MSNLQRYSVYDHMERKGVFRVNPANVDSRDSEGKTLYKGPQPYPKMFYHPEGEEKTLVPEHVEIDRGREMVIPAKYELIAEIAESPEAERTLRAAGWYDHPSKAIEAANKRLKAEGKKLKAVPLRGLDQVAQGLQGEVDAQAAELVELRAQLAALKAPKVPVVPKV